MTHRVHLSLTDLSPSEYRKCEACSMRKSGYDPTRWTAGPYATCPKCGQYHEDRKVSKAVAAEIAGTSRD